MFTSGAPDLQSLMQLLDAAQMGWWKADFRTGELFFSDYIVDLLGLGSNRAAVGELMPLTREDYRTRIHNEFLSLKVGNHFDETFPVVLPEGEIWIHTQLVRKQSDPQQGIKLFGYLQRVPVAGRKEADVLTLESNYYAVLKENKHMDELLAHLPIGYFRIRLLYDDDGRATDYLFLSVNQTAQQILGVDAADYLDKTAREIDIPVDRHIDELAAIRLGDYKMDQWHAAKTGRYCRSFLYNTPNDATEIVILILDITDVVTAHQALDEKEKLLRNVIQNAPIGIEIYDRTGHLVDINARDLEMFGVTDPAGIRGLSIFDNPNFSAEIKDCIREGRGTDFTTRYDFSKARSYYDTSRSGYIDWTARIRCLYNDTGEITHYLLINIDNTELRQTQDRLTEFETPFRLISEYAQVGYTNYNLCNKKGYAQGVWLRNYGEPDTAAIGDVIGKYRRVHPDDRTVLLNRLAQFESGEIQSASVSCRVLHDDGRTTWIKSHLICRDYRPQEQVIDMLGINYDITALNNGLLLQIISDVLDLSRIESGRIDPVKSRFNLRTLCREAVETFRLQAPEGVVLRIEKGLPSCTVCEYRQGVMQILANFIRNTLKFTTKGSVTVGFERKRDRLSLYVRDTGIGIPAGELDKIFERFYKVDTFTQGTGLGLSICKSIAEQMGAQIGVDSAVGEGSCFRVEMPIAE